MTCRLRNHLQQISLLTLTFFICSILSAPVVMANELDPQNVSQQNDDPSGDIGYRNSNFERALDGLHAKYWSGTFDPNNVEDQKAVAAAMRHVDLSVQGRPPIVRQQRLDYYNQQTANVVLKWPNTEFGSFPAMSAANQVVQAARLEDAGVAQETNVGESEGMSAWIKVPLIVVVAGAGAWLAYKGYRKFSANKIATRNQTALEMIAEVPSYQKPILLEEFARVRGLREVPEVLDPALFSGLNRSEITALEEALIKKVQELGGRYSFDEILFLFQDAVRLYHPGVAGQLTAIAMPVEMKLRLFGGFYERLGSAERIVFEWNASNLGLTHERGLLHALSEAPGKQLDNLYELMNTPSMSEFSGRAGGYGSAFRPETRSRMLEIVRKAHPESRFSYNAMRARETMLGLRGLNSALPFLVYLGAARTDETEAQLIRGEELDVVFEEIDMANEPRVKEIVRETKGFSQPTDPRRT